MGNLSQNRATRLGWLELLLKPIATYCLRHAHSFQDLVDVAKIAFVRAAEEEIRKSTAKVNVSRLSVMTGLYRKDVTRIFVQGESAKVEPQSILWRVIGQWEHDKRFTNRSGKPRALTFKGDHNEFRELVSAVSKDTDPGTVLFELQRIGVVEKSGNSARLLQEIQHFDDDQRRGFQLLSDDVAQLIAAAEENILATRKPSNLHISTKYDNIILEHLPEIRTWIIDEGRELHRRAREFLSKFDADISPLAKDEKQAGGYVTLTTFSVTSGWPSTEDCSSVPEKELRIPKNDSEA